MLNHKKFKICFEVLYNCEKWLPRRIRTQHNTIKFTQIARIFSENLTSYSLMTKSSDAKNTFTL